MKILLFVVLFVCGLFYFGAGDADARCRGKGRAGAVLERLRDRPHPLQRVKGVLGRVIHRR